MALFDKEKAFLPESKEEKKEKERLKAIADEERQRIYTAVAEMLKDERYLAIREYFEQQQRTLEELFKMIDMNDPARFQLWSDWRVLPGVFRKLEQMI